jgi:hypothetical protein
MAGNFQMVRRSLHAVRRTEVHMSTGAGCMIVRAGSREVELWLASCTVYYMSFTSLHCAGVTSANCLFFSNFYFYCTLISGLSEIVIDYVNWPRQHSYANKMGGIHCTQLGRGE